MIIIRDNRDIKNGDELGKLLIELIEDNLDLKRWNFYLAFTNFKSTNSLTAIYYSDWCKIRFMFSRQRLPELDELTIHYGRTHAPNEEVFMVWEGQECRCWHNVLDALRFLDGLSPLKAMEQVKISKHLPDVVRNFRQSESGKKLLNDYPPKSALVMHSILWEHYGLRLFELFDLHRPDLWEKYNRFIREYYDLLGMKSSYGPPYDRIC